MRPQPRMTVLRAAVLKVKSPASSGQQVASLKDQDWSVSGLSPRPIENHPPPTLSPVPLFLLSAKAPVTVNVGIPVLCLILPAVTLFQMRPHSLGLGHQQRNLEDITPYMGGACRLGRHLGMGP